MGAGWLPGEIITRRSCTTPFIRRGGSHYLINYVFKNNLS
jgi:hypothetical protein